MASWTAVRTFATGDVASATDFNTYVRDDPTYLYGEKFWTTFGAVGYSTNNVYTTWQDYGNTNYAPPGFRRVGDVVMCRGLIAAFSGTAPAANSQEVVIYLPTGYRWSGTPTDVYQLYNCAGADHSARADLMGQNGTFPYALTVWSWTGGVQSWASVADIWWTVTD